MAATEEKLTIDELIWRLIRRRIKNAVRIGKAVNIDTNEGTCDVQLDDEGNVFLYSVRLKAVESGAGIGQIIEPKKDSYVLAAMIDGSDNSWSIIQHTEIENWAVFCEKSKIELFGASGNHEVHVNGKSKGGVPVASDVVSRLNKIENDLNTVKSVFNSWTPANTMETDAAALKLAAATWAGQSLTETQTSDIENPKVKHGDNG